MEEKRVKYLIIRLSSIGDIVLTTPVIRCMKKQIEEAEIHYLTKKENAAIVENNPYIDKVHILKSDIIKTINELKEECFDYIIDLHKNLRTWRIKSHLKVYSFTFNKLNWEKWLMVNFKKNKLPNTHIVDRYLESVSIFDVVNDNAGLDFFIPPADEVEKTSLPAGFRTAYIAFVIGAKHFTKRLPTEKIIAIIEKLNSPVILLGGNDDVSVGETIEKHFAHRNTAVFNACGKFSLNASASLVKQAEIVITHDTGLMHIAAAFKKKIISVWGNTIPQFGMYPYMPHEASKIVEVSNLACRPCTKIGFRICPKKHFKCMQNISEDAIIEFVKTNFQKQL